MKKMKRVLVALLSCLTAFACLAGTVACGEDKKADSSTNNPASSVTESSKEEVASSEEASSEEEVSSEEVSSEEVSSEEVSSEEESSSEEASEEESSSDEEEPHECDLTSVLKKVAASCKDGYIQYGCKECGELGEKEVIPATGEHVIVNHAKKEATCTEAGYEAYQGCKNCDYKVDAIAVKPVEPVKPQWADFVVFGEDANEMYEDALVQYAIEYGKYESDLTAWKNSQIQVIPAKGHTYVETATIELDTADDLEILVAKREADCEVYGYEIEKFCAECLTVWAKDNEKAIDKAQEKAGSDFDVYAYLAKNASDIIEIEITSALGHDFVDPDTKKSTYQAGMPATCTKAGYEWSGKCFRDGCDLDRAFQSISIAKLGHDFENLDTNADGKFEEYTSSTKALDVNKDEKIDEKDFRSSKSKLATCTNDAYCGVCGYTAEEKADNGAYDDWMKLDHNYYAADGVFAATCTKDGLENAQVCVDCGDMIGDIVEATGHAWSVQKTKQEFEEEKEDKDFTLLCTEKWYEDHYICDECGAYGQAKFASKPDTKEGEDWDDMEITAINVVTEKEVIHKTGAAHKLEATYENAEGEEKTTTSIKAQIEKMHKDYIEGETTTKEDWESAFGSYVLEITCKNEDCDYSVSIDAEAHSYEYLADLNGNFSDEEVTMYVDADGNEYTEEELEWIETYTDKVIDIVKEYAVKAYAKDTVRKCSICSMTMCDINEEHYYFDTKVDVEDEAAVKAMVKELAELYELEIKVEDFAAFYNKNRVEAKAATCKAAGNRAYVICLCCGATLVEDGGDFVAEVEWDGQKVAAKDAIKIESVSAHDWNEEKAVLPTCTEDGYTAHKVCKICGAKDGYKVVKALGHKSAVTGSCANTVECDGYWTNWDDADKDGIVDEGEATWVDCKEHIANNSKAPHTWNDGTCKVCNAECAHKFVDGECTICKKED